jgi:hypothetical protein
MANTINADNGVVSTVPGLKYSADTSGELILQTNTTNALTLDTTQGATFSTGALVTNPYAGSYSSGMVLDHTTSLGRISVAASSAIAFYNGGISARVETMRISSTGNVGIGAASPVGRLDVYTAAGGTSYFRDATVQTYIGTNTANGFLGTGTNHPFVFNTNNTERMRISSAGNVSIGTTTVDQMVTVDGGVSIRTGNYLQLRPTSNAWDMRLQAVSTQLNIYSGGDLVNPIMSLLNGGNVGIGTSSPSQKLQVAGNVAIANGGWFGFGDVDERIAGDNAGFMQFFTSGTEKMRIDSSGNVGIGTSSPSTFSSKLAVAGNSGTGVVQLTVASGGNSGDYGIVSVATSTTIKGRMIADATSGDFRFDTAGSAAGGIGFFTGSSYAQRFIIGAAGQLGIGASPSYGTSGQVLVSQGSGSAPVWGSAVSAGQVIQVAQATNNTVYTISGSNVAMTGLSVTMTPRNSSSRFLLICNLGQVGQSSGGATVVFNFARNGSSLNFISGGTYNGMTGFIDNNTNLSFGQDNMSFLDSPATASAVTYTVLMSMDGTKWVGRRGSDDFIRTSQALQVLEIAG